MKTAEPTPPPLVLIREGQSYEGDERGHLKRIWDTFLSIFMQDDHAKS